jgi:hypothetical protein
MIINNVVVRPQGDRDISVTWTSENDEIRSYVYINGKLVVGAFRAGTTKRNIVLPIPVDKTYKIEVHDLDDDDVVPHSLEEPIQVKPLLSWNTVENAVMYKIYHMIFDTGFIESLLVTIPARAIGRMEIECPRTLEGSNGRWHYFRVEAVDQYGNESVNEIVPYFAVDLPPVPELMIARDTKTGLLSFYIL